MYRVIIFSYGFFQKNLYVDLPESVNPLYFDFQKMLF